MTTREFPPPEHQHRALRALIGCAVFFVLLVIGVLAVGAYFFTAPSSEDHEALHDAETTGWDDRGRRSLFEVEAEGQQEVAAEIDLALGRVTTALAERGMLFQAEGELTGDRLRPRFENERTGDVARISLSLDGQDVSFKGLRGTRGSEWQLYFSDAAPLDLDLSLGAAEAVLDFSGVPLRTLNLECGIASATVRFDRPNPTVLRRLVVDAGLSQFSAHGLGHARFEVFTFNGGAGEFILDFSGSTFAPGAQARLNVGLASLSLRIPRGQPVVIEAPVSFMTSVNIPASFTRLGSSTWSSPGASVEDGALHVVIDAGPGNVEVRLLD